MLRTLRTKYIIKPIQIKYLIMTLIVVAVTSIAVYYAFWSSLIRSSGLEQLSAGDLSALEHAYQKSFIWVVFILLTAVGLESIFLFHRLLGPIFVFERTIKKLAQGDFTISVHSRKRDELKDMAEDINVLIDNLRKNVIDEREKIKKINENIDNGNLSAAKEEVALLTNWFKV